MTTPAIDALIAAGMRFEVTETDRASSVEEAAAMRGVSVSALLKTIVVRLGDDDYRFVLVPGDRGIDWPKLRAHLGVRRMTLPDAEEAKAATGYERGTITPFGSTYAWPVIADASIVGSDVVSLGAGAHGISVTLDPIEMVGVLSAEVVDVTKPIG